MSRPFVTTAELEAALSERYRDEQAERYGQSPADVLLFEVPSPRTGQRSVDALCVRGWASRGYEVLGFEIKAGRSDWLRELKQPEKADPWIRRCHRWYVVAPTGLVRKDELPKGWGLLQLRADGKLVVAQRASLREPAPLSYPLLARLLRSAVKQSNERVAVLHREIETEAEKRAIKIASRSNTAEARVRRAYKAIRANLRRFEAETGLLIGNEFEHGLGLDRLVAAVKWARAHRRASKETDQLRRVAARLTKAADEWDADPLLGEEKGGDR